VYLSAGISTLATAMRAVCKIGERLEAGVTEPKLKIIFMLNSDIKEHVKINSINSERG
jgi:hypothetical protein